MRGANWSGSSSGHGAEKRGGCITRQDRSQASFFHKRADEDSRIDWSWPAENLDVLGASSGAASGGTPCSKSSGERARRRGAGGTLRTRPRRSRCGTGMCEVVEGDERGRRNAAQPSPGAGRRRGDHLRRARPEGPRLSAVVVLVVPRAVRPSGCAGFAGDLSDDVTPDVFRGRGRQVQRPRGARRGHQAGQDAEFVTAAAALFDVAQGLGVRVGRGRVAQRQFHQVRGLYVGHCALPDFTGSAATTRSDR
ncbi:hypothetical protein BV882_00575 [Streptomyces sp. 46]|nr:hypothetical protein BV882_00575 [Streptomyces sp. 46]